MKSPKLALVRDLPITPDHWDVPVPLRAQAYKHFCHRMDESLQRLVDRWAYLAAPNTQIHNRRTTRR